MRIADLAKETGVSTQSVYRAVQRLGNALDGHVSKKRGVSEVSEEGARLIRESLGQTTAKVIPVPAVHVADFAPISNRLEQIERAILCQIEQGNAILKENRILREENRDLRSELAAIRAENSAIRKLLTAPAVEKPAERSFSDELQSAVREIRETITGALAPFMTWFAR